MSQDIYVLIEHACGKTFDISYMMAAQARQVASQTGGQVVAILLGQNSLQLASDVDADSVWYVDHPLLADYIWENYLVVLEQLIAKNPPRLFLFGETSIGKGLAGGLSARCNLPQVSSCKQIFAEGGDLRYTSQLYGGKMMIEGPLPANTTLATMLPGAFKIDQGKRSAAQPAVLQPLEGLDAILEPLEQKCAIRKYVEPDSSDVDITRETVLVAVGRGIQGQENLDLAQELADALGGTVCATRPIIDQNWLPTSRLVGRSGKTVKPKLYLALGLSGAPEHTESITASETIIAVNTDPAAPIFNVARYGAEIDVLDLLPALIEKMG